MASAQVPPEASPAGENNINNTSTNTNTNGNITSEPKHGGYTRFEIELEFVQSLANPYYLNHLAAQKLLQQPAFVEYLRYLQYWGKPPYIKYLTYPGPTLKHLELLQQERFRRDIISPDLVNAILQEGTRAAVEWHKEKDF